MSPEDEVKFNAVLQRIEEIERQMVENQIELQEIRRMLPPDPGIEMGVCQ